MLLKNLSLHKISLYLLYLLPISLISGPAIPDISITLICILFIVHIINTKEFWWIKEGWIKAAILFWFSLLLISFFAKDKFSSFADSIVFIRLILLSIAIYVWIIQERKHLKNLSIIFFITIIFIISDSLYQFLSYDPAMGYGKDIFGFVPKHYGRLTGPFNDQVPGSHLTRFFFVSILVFIYFFDKNKINSTIFFFYVLLNGLTIFVSGEAMSIATFFLGFIILIIIFKEYRKFFLFSFISLILLITLLLKNHKSYHDYDIIKSTPYHLGLVIEKKFKCDENSLNICTKTIITNPEFITVIKNFGVSVYAKIYTESYRMWLDNKITGIGLNNYESLCKQNSKYSIAKENYGNCSSHPHNFYLQWLVESGIIGFCLFLTFVTMIFKKLIHNINYTTSKIGFISLVVIFWPISSTGSLLKNWYGIEVFLLVGLSLVCTKKIFKNKN